MNKTKAHNQTVRMVWIDDIPAARKEISDKKMERRVFKLQKRIYKASQRGDVKALRRLQKTLVNSWSAQSLAAKKVTQDNPEQKTEEREGVKSLTSKERLTLARNLKICNKTKPLPRVRIPKLGKDKKRPLGISVIEDRAKQILLRMALEPEWEGKFKPNGYGFRPARNAHDVIRAISKEIEFSPKYVLNADLGNCFDGIKPEQLLTQINTYPKARKQLKAWPKSGLFNNKQGLETNPENFGGGVISPLLVNIALHGLEERLKQYAESLPEKQLTVISYGNNFLVLHQKLEVINQCKEILSEWLAEIGLKLKPNQTRIAHTLKELNEEKPGFNFLGFNIRQFKVGKRHSGKAGTTGERLEYSTVVRPSDESIKTHYQKISTLIEKMKAAPQKAVIKALKPVIEKWARYFAPYHSSESFKKLDNLIWNKLRAWAKRRHPNRQSSQDWVSKYWHQYQGKNWCFSSKEKGEIADRLPKHQEISKRVSKSSPIKTKKNLLDDDKIYWEDSLPLLLKQCRDTQTNNDLEVIRGTHAKSHNSEEPDEVKVSRPVLKTSRPGDGAA